MDDDIRRALEELAEEVRPASPLPPSVRRRARLRAVAAGAGALLVVSVAGIGGAMVLRSEPDRARTEIAGDPEVAEPEPQTPAEPPRGSIAFIANGRDEADQFWEVYAVEADGSDYRRLTPQPLLLEGASTVAWSPDGEKAVFTAGTGEGTGGLRVLDARSGDVSTIYEGSGDDAVFGPDWSPDGTRLVAFNAVGDLVLMDADGSGHRRLTDSGQTGGHIGPSWSPDGARIAFACDCGGDSGIYVMDAGGGGQEKIVGGASHNPRWSPDGTRIAYNTQRGQIHVVDVETGEDVQLTDEAENFDPTWSPDGAFIAFSSDRAGNLDIFVMTAAGDDETAVTTTPVEESSPAWRPSGG